MENGLPGYLNVAEEIWGLVAPILFLVLTNLSESINNPQNRHS